MLIQSSVYPFVHPLIHLFPMYKAPCWLLGANRWRHPSSKFNNPVEPRQQWPSKQRVSKRWYVPSARRKWRIMQEHRTKGTYLYSGRKDRWEVLYWRQVRVCQAYIWKEISFLAQEYLVRREKKHFLLCQWRPLVLSFLENQTFLLSGMKNKSISWVFGGLLANKSS